MKALPATKLIAELKPKAQRFQKLRELFQQFCKESAWLATSESPVPGIRHAPDLDRNRLDIEFCGEHYRLQFTMEMKTSKGVVTCMRIPPDEAMNEPQEVGRFTFVSTEDTDVIDPQLGDPLRLNLHGDAAHLVLQLLHGACAAAPNA